MSGIGTTLECSPVCPVEAAGADELPVTIIEHRPGWRMVSLVELWRCRELLYFLVWRDVKVRYKQTALGAAWAVLQPFGTMLVLSLFLGRVAALATPVAYPLFVFAALLPWTFFANAVSAASQSVLGNQNLVTKVYFPRLVIPMGAVGAGLIDFAVGVGMLVPMIVFYGAAPGLGVLCAPFLAAGLMLAALGIGALLAALTVAYRDFRYVIPFLVQLWMFATPCIYMDAQSALPARWQAVLALNPAYGWISSFRAAVLGRELDLPALGISAAVTLLLLVAGCLYFRRVERTFADII